MRVDKMVYRPFSLKFDPSFSNYKLYKLCEYIYENTGCFTQAYTFPGVSQVLYT